jgi:predicted DNA-binding WGR domain protein
VDRGIPGRESYVIYQDFTAKLNQTDCGGNNNKFFVIQVLEQGDKYFAWNRWGRVGYDGQTKLEPHPNPESAIKSFKAKFREKSGNAWDVRDAFVPKSGKYTFVEMEDEEDRGGNAAPLGKLSKAQIEKGMDVLTQLRERMDADKAGKKEDSLVKLSNSFFSLIPTNFGFKVPAPITTEDVLCEKEELLKFWLRMGFEDMEEDASLTPIDGIMGLQIPKTLSEAAAGVCSKREVDSSTRQGEALAKKQAGSPSVKMAGHFYASVMLYTSNAIYKQLNKALREKKRGAISAFRPYLRLLFAAMDALPQRKSTLWRGIPADLYDQYTVGSTQTWWNVSSCTADESVARNFMKGCGGKCTLLTVEAETACDISAITFYSNEKESLLAPGTQLRVKSSKRSGNITEITLEEVGRAVR